MSYITGDLIRKLREKQKMTQKDLADRIMVSDKTVSKWETGKGLPDIGIIDELAKALGITITDLLTGEYKENDNLSANMIKTHIYVCPVCGNAIFSAGAGSFSCCGIALPELQVETPDDNHTIMVETVEDEYHVYMNHPMEKKHYISFLAYVTSESIEVVKLYPQQDVSVRFRKKGHGYFYAYCNRHGLFQMRV